MFIDVVLLSLTLACASDVRSGLHRDELKLYESSPNHALFMQIAFVPMHGRASYLCVTHNFEFVVEAVRALRNPHFEWTRAKPLAIKQLRQAIEATLGKSLAEFDPASELNLRTGCGPMFTD